MVNLVNNGGQLESIGVTLQMGGMLVSGSIVSGAEYFDRFAASFTGSLDMLDADARDAVHRSLAELGMCSACRSRPTRCPTTST